LRRALNLKNFRSFAQQVKGVRVTEISVSKEDGPKGARLKYSARDPKTRRVFNGEWVAEGGADDEKEFYTIAEKEFAIRRAAEE
jgi:hypothetical protein